jgi:hypothetical protein
MQINNNTIGGSAWPALVAGTENGQRPVAPAGARDVYNRASQALEKLQKARAGGVDQQALEQAVGKMSTTLSIMAGAEGLDSAMAQIMREQSKQCDDACKRAEGTIKDRFETMRSQTRQQRAAVKKRQEAMENRSWWEKLVNFFKDVFDVGVAIAGACTGNPAGIAAAALKLSGLIVGKAAGDSDAGRWTSFGLSLGGGLLGAFGGDQAATAGAQKVADTGNQIVQGAANYFIGECDHDALDANADLMELRAARKQAQSTIEQEKETIKAFVEAHTRGVRLVTKIMNNNQRVAGQAAF